ADVALHYRRAGRWRIDARHHFQKCALACPVKSDQTNALALSDSNIDPLQCVECVFAWIRSGKAFSKPILEAAPATLARETNAHTIETNGQFGHSRNTSRLSS